MRVQQLKNIVISGSDNLKDFSISIQIISYLKNKYTDSLITWIGNSVQYEISKFITSIDQFILFDTIDDNTLKDTDAIFFLKSNKELSKKARDLKVSYRIGGKDSWRNNRRLTHSIDTSTATSLLDAHLSFLHVLDIDTSTNVKEQLIEHPIAIFRGIIKKDLKNIVFYPYRSNAHRAWPGIRYFELIDSLPKYENNYIIAGLEEEGKALKFTAPELFRVPSVKDATDLESLEEVLALIAKSDVLITYNTDISNFAEAMGKKVICITSSADAFFINKKIKNILTEKTDCFECIGDKPCECLKKLGTEEVIQFINE
ncbi:glycosyltransferase family 9 protein [Flammeovirga kamogawensis]|uniref:Glycosyltransferase family 9 protein n=1 Tax=Flammeovirga kamogawensis TaxID=373891 RepID=A0ABX8GTE7_9BACT|nr:glycosyltransferase family 9 protein [Flammeovirga kamogawensis]MBB6463700.1 ADP-heptose:LPS heptosyltransferase [Flammeovirga kamogawensis]QWG06200.1 glycosyltransferase family 9 protein [Flammeovirga kamogawensis]TRX68031.1 glycosyltransferase family 9 protein [Flammeovirga kamogawensis]